MPLVLRVNSVSKTFHDDKESLRALLDVSFSLEEGTLCALRGPSGSGKTTLLNIIAGFDSPDQGEVYLGEERIDTLEESSISRLRTKKIGIVFQAPNLVSHLNALENVLLPTLFLRLPGKKSNSFEEEATRLLNNLRLGDKAQKPPSKLSEGEKRRISIARALVTKPNLILADEPTINLDSENRDIVMSLFKDYTSSGGAAIVATHDEEVAESSDSTMKIRFGKVSA